MHMRGECIQGGEYCHAVNASEGVNESEGVNAPEWWMILRGETTHGVNKPEGDECSREAGSECNWGVMAPQGWMHLREGYPLHEDQSDDRAQLSNEQRARLLELFFNFFVYRVCCIGNKFE